jgi:hypothetical protein
MKHLKHASEIFAKISENILEKPLQYICNIQIATPKINTLAICF